MADVFISYSRTNRDFVHQLHEALAKASRDAWVDWEDIPLTAEWHKEIYSGIEAADNFIFVISPESLVSAACRDELAHAAGNNKRLIPVLRQAVSLSDVPDCLAKLNFIYFQPDDSFDSNFNSLIDALDTDLDWKAMHTRLLVRAREWEQKSRNASFLLRGEDLLEAEEWLAQGSNKEPKPTTFQGGYIRASRHAAIKRQRITLVAVTVAFLVTVVLAVVAIWQAHAANEQRLRAEKRFQEVRRLANSVLFDFHDAISELPGATAARKLLVSTALTYLDNLSKEAGQDEGLQRELGFAYMRIGDLQGNPAQANLGDSDAALASYLKADALLEAAASKATDWKTRAVLATTLVHLGDIYWTLGRPKESMKEYRRSTAIEQALVSERPNEAAVRGNLGHGYNSIGDLLIENNDFLSARKNYEEGLHIADDLAASYPNDLRFERDLGVSYEKMGDVTWWEGKWSEAFGWYHRALAIREELEKHDRNNVANGRSLIETYNALGDTLIKKNEISQAVPFYEQSLRVATQLAKADPNDTRAVRDHMMVIYNLAGIMRQQRNYVRESSLDQQYYDMALALWRKSPKSRVTRSDLSAAQERVGSSYMRKSRPDLARQWLEKSLAIRFEDYQRHPNADSRRELLGSYLAMGNVCIQMSRTERSDTSRKSDVYAEAGQWYGKANALRDEMLRDGSPSPVDEEAFRELDRALNSRAASRRGASPSHRSQRAQAN